MTHTDDLMQFCPEGQGVPLASGHSVAVVTEQASLLDERPWKILVVDDDVDIHHVTGVVFSTLEFHGRSVKMLSAYSAEQALASLKAHPDIALMLLDIVMETQSAGLDLISQIREKMGLKAMRIVLRTGQPGQAPEQDVILKYDINDYRAKTELTAQKLLTLTVSALRAFEAIGALERSQDILKDANTGLERMVQERTAALALSEAHYRAVLDAIPDGVVVVDRGGMVRSASPAAAKLFRTRCEVLQEQPLTNLFDSQHMGDVVALVADACAQRLLQTEWMAGREVKGCRLDGTTFPMDCSVNRLMHDGSIQLVITMRDATQRYEHQENLRQAHLKAEEASRAKSDFLAVMSHEIRTPLNGILGMAQILRTDLADEEQRELSDLILNAGESLLRVLNDVLDFSKLESGRFELEETGFVLRKVVQDVIGMMIGMASERDVSLSWNAEGPIDIPLIGDPMRLRQVLLNLVSNALKFTEKGYVRVHVETALIAPEQAEATWRNGALLVDLRVVDSGIGISEERMDKLFEHFSQVDSTISRRFGGTGLGLAICKKLVEAMSGKIYVQSEEGQGSTFTVRLTLACSPSSDREEEQEALVDSVILETFDKTLGSEQTESFIQLLLDDVLSYCDARSAQLSCVLPPPSDLEPTARRIGCIALAEALRDVSLRAESPTILSALEKTLQDTTMALRERYEKISR